MSRRVGTKHLCNYYFRPILNGEATICSACVEGAVRRWDITCSLVVTQPIVSLLLCRQNLAPAHAGGENGNPIFAGLISTCLRQDGPKVGFRQILRHAPACPVVGT